jgi:cell volume regulation protein A
VLATPVPPAFTLDDLTPVLLLGTLVLLVSVAAVRFAVRAGLPTLLLYLAIGLAIGNEGLGIRFDSAELTQVLGYSALILILAEGGLTTSWAGIRSAVAPAAVLSTIGVVVSVVVVGFAAHWILDVSLEIGFLVGAVVSSTDAAAVFSVLRRVPLPARLSGVLEAESGFNDAPVVLLVVVLAHQAVPGAVHDPAWQLVLIAAGELAGGAAVGLAVGFLGGFVMRRAASTSSGLFSIGILSLTVLAYAVAVEIHASGFLATYVAALVLGNIALPHRPAIRAFAQAMGWLAQIGLFVLLGLEASPSQLVPQIVPAIAIGLVLLLVARPASVLLSMLPFPMPLREQLFLSWAGLRGAVPVVLATVPLTVGTPHTGWLFNLVFNLVIIFTIVQGPALPWVARRLGITGDHHTVDLELETTPLEELGADVLQVQVGPESQLHGVEVFELRLPVGANVTLIVRDREAFVPDARTPLRRGDSLLIVTTGAARGRAEARLRAVSERGRLAGWNQ